MHRLHGFCSSHLTLEIRQALHAVEVEMVRRRFCALEAPIGDPGSGDGSPSTAAAVSACDMTGGK